MRHPLVSRFSIPLKLALCSSISLACASEEAAEPAPADSTPGVTAPGGGECTPELAAADACVASPPGGGTPFNPGIGPNGQPPPVIMDDQGAGGAATGADCIEVVTGFEKLIPTVLLVIDRSASMDMQFDMNRDRWTTVRDALIDPTDGMIKKLESEVRFGLSLYTSVNPPGEPSTVFDVCPLLVDTPIAINNYAAIEASFMDTPLFVDGQPGHTPTSESLAAATETLAAFTEEGPKAIILATDGDPDNCMDADANRPEDPDGMMLSKSMSVTSVQTAFEQEIKTYVIGVGDDIAGDHLKELAVTGQGSPDAEPYSALNTTDLEAAFTDIVGDVRSCSFSLVGKVPQSHAQNGVVSLGGMEFPFNDPNGWVLSPDGTKVEVQGTACEAVKATVTPVSITFPCIPGGPK